MHSSYSRGSKAIGNRKISKDEIDWSNFRNWGGESLREDAKNCFYPVIIEDDEIIGFGDVLSDDDHPRGQTIREGDRYYVYPIDRKRIERKWRYARQSVEEIAGMLRAKKANHGYEIEIGKDFGTYRTVWQDSRYDASIYGTQLINSLVPNNTFDFPKSLWNVYDCLYAAVASDKDALILDFFAGSGTTAHAVLELNKDGGNRKFILCEQMHYVQTVTRERISRVIEQNDVGNFVYCELLKYNEAFMDRIQAAGSSEEMVQIWGEMAEGSFLNWYVNPAQPEEAVADFIALGQEEHGLEKQKHLLAALLDKNQLYVNLSEIDDSQFGVSDDDKRLNRAFYGD